MAEKPRRGRPSKKDKDQLKQIQKQAQEPKQNNSLHDLQSTIAITKYQYLLEIQDIFEQNEEEPIQEQKNQTESKTRQEKDPASPKLEDKSFKSTFKIKKKKLDNKNLEDSKNDDQNSDNKDKDRMILVDYESMNINKTFQEILQYARDENFMTKLRNVLSYGNKILQDRVVSLKKRWIQLKNANISQIEYLNKERDLKRAEVDEIQEIKLNTINQLFLLNIKGFETPSSLIDKFQIKYFENLNLKRQEEIIVPQLPPIFYMTKDDQQSLQNDQMNLIDKLMRENNLISQEFSMQDIYPKMHSNHRNYEEQYNQGMESEFQGQAQENQQILSENHTKNKMSSDAATQQILDYEYFITDFNKSTQQQPKNIQKLQLCRYFEETADMDMELEDGESRSLLSRLFDDYQKFIKVSENDYFIIPKRTKGIILDTKSDELFTDEIFLKEQYDKYATLLKKMQDDNKFNVNEVDDKTLQGLMEVCAYIVNNVHYHKKFNQTQKILNPIDLAFILDKFSNRSGLQSFLQYNQQGGGQQLQGQQNFHQQQK